jgi:phosphoenolpyruvate carboxylase
MKENNAYTILISYIIFYLQIQAAFRTDEIRRAPPTPQDEMRAGMSYFNETIWKGVPKFLRRVDTALKNIGINERVPYNAPLIQFSSWMGGDRDDYDIYFIFFM